MNATKRIRYGLIKLVNNNSKNLSLHKKTVQLNENANKKLNKIINSFLLLPDENRNWIIPALYKAVKLIKEKKINIVLTTCPPYSVHIIGLILKYIFDIKWIADYRDAWI